MTRTEEFSKNCGLPLRLSFFCSSFNYLIGSSDYNIFFHDSNHIYYTGSVCLAISSDGVHFKKFKDNPVVIGGGPEGAWDEGAIWFTTVEKINGIYHMWYEGYGGGTARTEAYGTYLEGGKSQIGLATLEADYFYVDPKTFR